MTRVWFGCQATRISVTLADVSSLPLAVVVGGNCKLVRSKIGVTQDELARCARFIGLRWNAAKVGDFEAGRSAPTFATVLAVTLALQMALDDAAERRGDIPEEWARKHGISGRVTLADLVGGEGEVALTGSLSVPAAQVEAVCRGRAFHRFDLQYNPPPTDPDEMATTVWVGKVLEDNVEPALTKLVWEGAAASTLERSGLTEHRLAKRLSINRARLAHISFQLWQSTFSEERDRRAGPDANQQKRGRVSRELRAELEEALANGG